MNSDVVKQYLVKLGYDIDQPQLNRFNDALRTSAQQVTKFAGGMTREFVEAGVAITSALTAISVGAVGMMSEVAKGDLQMQLLARRMFMSLPAMREMKMALDALGVSAEEVIYGPPELRSRYNQLISDTRRVMGGMGAGDFEKEMLKIRQVEFQFQRLRNEAGLFVMALTKSLSKALTGDEEGLLKKLQGWNEWLITNIPQLAEKFSTYLVPVLRDVKDIWKDIGDVLKVGVSGFITMMGVLANDQDMQKGEVNVDNIGKAMKYLADWAKAAADAVAYLADSLGKLPSWYIKYAFPPTAIPHGAYSLGHFFGGGGDTTAPTVPMSVPAPTSGRPTSPADVDAVKRMILSNAAQYGRIPGFAEMAMSVAHVESGYLSNALSGKGAMGVMQLMPGTAKGINPWDPTANIGRGEAELARLYGKYHNWPMALEAYNWGEGNLSSGKPLPTETQKYVKDVLSGVTINIYAQTQDPREHAQKAADELFKRMSQHMQLQSNPVFVT